MDTEASLRKSFDGALAFAESNAPMAAKAKRLLSLADRIIEYSGMRKNIVCKRGCNYCCYENVAVTLAEAELIQKATGIKRADLKTKFKAYKVTNAKRCSFLKDGECSIYDDRPLACRAFHSYDSAGLCAERHVTHKVSTIDSNQAIQRIAGELLAISSMIDDEIKCWFPVGSSELIAVSG